MVIMIRVDDRLIHGQVALVWSKELNTPGIVVANDHAAKTPAVAATLKMAVPAGKKLLVLPVKGAIDIFNDERGKNMRIFCLCRNVNDAWELVKNCPGQIQAVDIANVGRFDGIPVTEKHEVFGGNFLTEADLVAARNLCQIDGVEVFHQIIPSDAKQSLKSELEKKNLL